MTKLLIIGQNSAKVLNLDASKPSKLK